MERTTFARGFSDDEFAHRVDNLQTIMHQKRLDAVLLSTEANIFYFTGFLTQFWKSPTRPWFVVVPATGKPIAVIPSIGESGMEECYVDRVITWSSPNPEDDGVSALTQVLSKLCVRDNRVGLPMGQESFLQMPLNNFHTLQQNLRQVEWVDVALDIYKIRSVKSQAEIERIAYACDITQKGFELLPSHIHSGQTERDMARQMSINLLYHGADFIEYLICCSGQNGYDSIIMGPTDKLVQVGDIAVFDLGATFDGYFSDFCRNFAFGHLSDKAKRAHDVIQDSIDNAFNLARPGMKTCDLFNAMWSVLEEGGALGSDVGRLGHGLGCELTEWPSNTPDDQTILVPNMVLTLESGMYFAEEQALVHEENIVITEDGARWLSTRTKELMVVD